MHVKSESAHREKTHGGKKAYRQLVQSKLDDSKNAQLQAQLE